MKRLPGHLRMLSFAILALPLVLFGCQQKTLTPSEGTQHDDAMESLARISASNFDNKTTITQGFAGTVFKITRGEWAIGGFVIEDATPIEANVGVYAFPDGDSVYTFRAPDPTLIQKVRSDAEGFYQLPLDPGYYLVAVSEEALPDTLLLYDQMVDFGWFQTPDYLMTSVQVFTDSVRKIDFYLEQPDVNPWWPPEDSTINYPPDDSTFWPPDDSTFWPPDDSTFWPPEDSLLWPPDDSTIVWPPDSGWIWPGDSTEAYYQYMLLLDQNREKVSVQTGVFGTVTEWTGDFMPGGFIAETIKPARYPVRVYRGITWSSDSLDTYPNSMIVKSVFSDLVAETTPDQQGFYQFELPAGEYSVFAVIGQDSMIYAPEMMMGPTGPFPGLLPPGAIAARDIHEVNLENTTGAIF